MIPTVTLYMYVFFSPAPLYTTECPHTAWPASGRSLCYQRSHPGTVVPVCVRYKRLIKWVVFTSGINIIPLFVLFFRIYAHTYMYMHTHMHTHTCVQSYMHAHMHTQHTCYTLALLRNAANHCADGGNGVHLCQRGAICDGPDDSLHACRELWGVSEGREGGRVRAKDYL